MQRTLVALVSLVFPLATMAADPASPGGAMDHSASLTWIGDNDEGSQGMADLLWPVGERSWVRGLAGNTRSQRDERSISTAVAGLFVGTRSDNYSGSLGYVFRRDGSAYEQGDLFASFNRLLPAGKIGLDLYYRNAESQTDYVVGTDRRGEDIVVTSTDKVDGPGAGIHGEYDLTPDLTVYTTGAWYDYEASNELSGPTDFPIISGRFLNSLGVSAATREEGNFDASYSLGGAYRWQDLSASVTAYRDEIFDTSTSIDTLELAVTVLLANGKYSITPVVSQSSGGEQDQDDIVSAGVTFSVAW